MSGAASRVDTATVLFTDLVGSTSQRARIGEEAADRLRNAHDVFVRAAIESNRGTVVKHTGDGVMATFSAAVDAVAAAVAIQQAVDLHNRRGETEPIVVRIGISVGDVTFEGDDCFGLPVVEAQRLEAAADGGKILCADIVRHLARGRGGHEFVVHGDLELKGIPGTVPTAEVRWAPLAEVVTGAVEGAPLPPALASPAAFPLSGRVEIFDRLVAEWKESAAGSRRVVLLAGEPGVGKTRLATELALVARDQDALVLAGRCDEDLGLAFQPFVEALRFQLELPDDVAPAGWLGSAAGELVRLVPEVAERLPGAAPTRSDADSERARLFEAVVGWLRTTAAAVPLLLVLDDLHWADPPTLALLRHLVHETANDRIMVLGTYRDTDLDRSHPLAGALAELRRLGAVQRIAIDGLDRDGVAQLLSGAAGHALDDAGRALADAIFAETTGNPFFVGEIVRNLVESGALVVRDGRWTSDLTLADVGLPEGVREVVGRRISRLDDDTQHALSIAAVVGAEFDVRVLADVAGIDEDDALDQLDRARATGLVNEVGLDRYRFGHALVRTTLLEELTTTRRIRTHRKVAEAIEARHAGDPGKVLTELAFHFGEAAAAGVAVKAVDDATRAGDAAMATSAPDDAIRWYSAALEHLEGEDDPATEVGVLTRLARAQQQSAFGDLRDTVIRAASVARDAGLADAMAEVLLLSARMSFDVDQPEDPEKIALLEDVIGRLDAPALRARAQAALAVELIYVGDTRRFALLDEALASARDSGDPLALVDTTHAWFNAVLVCDVVRRREFGGARAARGVSGRGGDVGRSVLAGAGPHGERVLVPGHVRRPGGAGLARPAAPARRPVRHPRGPGRGADDRRDGRRHRRRPRPGRGDVGGVLRAEQCDGPPGGSHLPGHHGACGPARAGSPARAPARLARRTGGRRSGAQPDQRGRDVHARLGRAARRGRDAGRSGRRERLRRRPGRRRVADGDRAARGDGGADRRPGRGSALAEIVRPFAVDRTAMMTGGLVLGPANRVVALLESTLGNDALADAAFALAIEDAERLESPIWSARTRLDWVERLVALGQPERAAVLIDGADAAMGDRDLPALRRQRDELRV